MKHPTSNLLSLLESRLVCCTHLALEENRTTRASVKGQDFKSASFHKLSEATRHIPISLLRQGLRPRLALNLCLPRTEIADMRHRHPVDAVEPDASRMPSRRSDRQLCWRTVDTAEFIHDHGPRAFLEQQGGQKGQSPRRYQVTGNECHQRKWDRQSQEQEHHASCDQLTSDVYRDS